MLETSQVCSWDQNKDMPSRVSRLVLHAKQQIIINTDIKFIQSNGSDLRNKLCKTNPSYIKWKKQGDVSCKTKTQMNSIEDEAQQYRRIHAEQQ